MSNFQMEHSLWRCFLPKVALPKSNKEAGGKEAKPPFWNLNLTIQGQDVVSAFSSKQPGTIPTCLKRRRSLQSYCWEILRLVSRHFYRKFLIFLISHLKFL